MRRYCRSAEKDGAKFEIANGLDEYPIMMAERRIRLRGAQCGMMIAAPGQLWTLCLLAHPQAVLSSRRLHPATRTTLSFLDLN